MINDLKEFEKFLKICRKQGVTEVSYHGTVVKLGDLPAKASGQDAEEGDEVNPQDLTPEQLMYLAVNGAS